MRKGTWIFIGLALAFAFFAGSAQAGAGNWHSVTKNSSAWRTDGGVSDLAIMTVPCNAVIEKVETIVNVDFAADGGSATAATISVGTSASATRYSAANNVFTGVSNGHGNAYISTAPGNETKGTDIKARLTTTGVNVDRFDMGQSTFHIYYSCVKDPG